MLGLSGIKLRLTRALVLSVLVTAIALTLVTNVLVSLTFQLSLKDRANAMAKVVQQAVHIRVRQLAASIEVLTQNPQFQQDYSFENWDKVREQLQNVSETSHASTSVIIDLKGEIKTSLPKALVPPQALLSSVALAESQKSNKTATTNENIGDKLLLVAACPIVYYGQSVGYAITGSLVDAQMLGQLKETSGADAMVLVQKGKVIGEPIEADANVMSGIEQKLGPQVELVAVDGMQAEGSPLLASAIPLRASGKLQAALVFALSKKEASAIKQRVTRASLALGALIIVIAGLLGLFVARRISDPIVEIEQSFRHIATSGDLSQRITKPYRDEVGLMAESFNHMQGRIEELHDRVVRAEQRMRSELQMASAVQEMLFPATSLKAPNCEFASFAKPSSEVGGDWYTLVHTPNQHTSTVVIADVTGHGAPAALVTAIVHGFFKATAETIAQTHTTQWSTHMRAMVNTLNQVIIDSTRRSLVVSVFILSVDHKAMVGRYINAGHIAPMLVRNEEGRPKVAVLATPPSSLVGDVDQPNFMGGEIPLTPGLSLLLYTDGLIDCVNPQGEQYGLRRLRALLGENANLDAHAMRDVIQRDVMGFANDAPLVDDMTFVVARVS